MPVVNKKAEDPADEQSYSVSSNGKSPRKADGDAWNIGIPKIKSPKVPKLSDSPRRRGAVGLLAALLLGAAAGFAGGYWGAGVRADNGTLGNSLSAQKKVVTSQSQLISQIAKSVGPSVVSVDVVSTAASSGLESLFGGSGDTQQKSAGTGIVISDDGLIVTNRHVVPAGTTSVSVTLSDGTELKNVEVLGRTNDGDSLDIAFLKITDAKGHKLVPAALGDSSQLQVGDAVVAIGNALGQFQNTVTSGIISGYGRNVQAGDSTGQSAENLDDLFQTDAAINEGNSGGPLVNLNGQVIGINTAIAAGSAQNIGFAIPINDVTGLIKQIKSTGKLQRPYLGVRYIALTPDVARENDVDITSGAFIAPSTDPANPSILAGSPAEKAGLKAGDVITRIDDTKIDQTHSLTSIINKHQVGDRISLTIVRDGKTIHQSATLEAVPST
jgi:S1-C subfamily serine protease